ncbi:MULTISPECIES: tRNA (adenosine(37)-N6)-dimethylallyltransferase MiaA [Nocardiopsis]|jgi:tRNA dimethylallyltransferase|uniref:tRNA dimethylallyltransferase n=1 Tax=Nocardiopsis alba TaxID=53437 RepID=A0A7K2IWD3_9ACTN|nr:MULTISPECIES: tRNA (adenosine(37)-N6)-dimethylallyltransferase MiaA [Nocardiopsis]MEC3892384.1 tRNA (adenosine(37)-N6)-dimethylallyltransferase MiaA [Nocardiopsis sp. LDBS1602]MYR34261.1 tRNA (adenosine(37)-N6)-dimethylallyltransferase MiaA [Nocardiopsis alba]
MIKVIAVVGPTAVGKSDLAVDLASRLEERTGRRGEVINADSMQLYRGMDIGTAKLPESERRGVPHHLLDIWEVHEPADVASYQTLARERVEDCADRDVVPILVGGSGLYVRAVLDHMDFPGTDPEVRARLEAELADVGPGLLHARLAEADPAAARTILPGNGRRIVRALEVIELTGRPFTANLPDHTSFYPCVQLGLTAPRPELDERIDLRVERMWDGGLLEEVRRLDPLGLREGRTASKALGYAQALSQLDGDLTEAEAKESTARATRRFARRQESWFRRDPRVRWLPYDAPNLVERAMTQVESALSDRVEEESGEALVDVATMLPYSRS